MLIKTVFNIDISLNALGVIPENFALRILGSSPSKEFQTLLVSKRADCDHNDVYNKADCKQAKSKQPDYPCPGFSHVEPVSTKYSEGIT